MPHRIRDGLIDYLEILQMAGVPQLGPPARIPEFVAATPNEAKPEIPSEPEISTEETEEAVSPKLSKKKKSEMLQLLAGEVAQCSRCQELVLTRTQTVFGVGNSDSKLVFLGEAPGADEDKQGEPFVGRAGKLLDDIITKGMKLRREDVYICNILRCRPPGNRNPLPEEAEHCRPYLDGTLDIIRPKFICCLGAVAAKNLLRTEDSIGSMRGNVLRYDASFGPVKVVCTYHPAYLLRNPAAKKQTWDDIKLLMREMGLPVE